MAEQPKEPMTAKEIQIAAPELMYGRQGIALRTFDELHRFANYVIKSSFAPKGMTKVEDAMAAIQLGAEVGLAPMSALQRIAVINGRPSVWGDALLGICQRSGRFDHSAFRESFEGAPYEDSYTAVCFVKRIGSSEGVESRYSVADAKKAGLWSKQGTWQTNPKRMLKYRARAFALRDAFADVVTGLYDRDEMLDADIIEPRTVSSRDVTDAEIADGLRKKPEEPPAPTDETTTNSTGEAPPIAPTASGPPTAPPAPESPAQPAPGAPSPSGKQIGEESDLYGEIKRAFDQLGLKERSKIRADLNIATIRTIGTWSLDKAMDALAKIEAELPATETAT